MGDISHVPLLCFPLLIPFHFLPSKIRFPMLVEGVYAWRCLSVIYCDSFRTWSRNSLILLKKQSLYPLPLNMSSVNAWLLDYGRGEAGQFLGPGIKKWVAFIFCPLRWSSLKHSYHVWESRQPKERPQWPAAGSQHQLASHMSEPLGSGSSMSIQAAPCGREISLPCRALPKLLICGQINGYCCCRTLNFVLFCFLVVVGGLNSKR